MTLDYPPLVPLRLLPEGTSYPDAGCGLFPTCLRCPLPACVFDADTPSLRADATAYQVLALLEEGLTVPEIVARTDLSRRTVFRAKARLLGKLARVSIAA